MTLEQPPPDLEQRKFVRFSPAFLVIELPWWFADRVEIDSDNLTIPRGVWLAITPELIVRLRKKLDAADGEDYDRIAGIIQKVQSA